MSKRRRSVLLAVLTLVLCLALAVSGTYALFTDKVTLQNHMQAGELDVKLYRTKLVAKTLDPATGLLTQGTPNTTRVDFSDPDQNTQNVFGLTGSDVIVPECTYTADMLIVNETDVAFGYWVELVFNAANYTAQKDLKLAEQLEVSVTIGTQSAGVPKSLTDSAAKFGSETAPIGILTKEVGKNEAAFTISVKFVGDDNEENNKAMLGDVTFDVVVHAIQVTQLP